MSLAAGLDQPAGAQQAQETPRAAAAELSATSKPAKKASPKKPARAAKKTDPQEIRERLEDVAKVHRDRMVFTERENKLWRDFLLKLRDERGRYEIRLKNQRASFLATLHTMDSLNHGQSLLDFEAVQDEIMCAFEDRQATNIKGFILERVDNIQEFGKNLESERLRLSKTSEGAWTTLKSAYNIKTPPPPSADTQVPSQESIEENDEKE